MIEKTIFDNKKIKNVVFEKYGIKVENVEKLNRGSANIYSLNNNKYILKEFQSKYTFDDINKEIKIINHLSNDNMLVPKYIETNDGQYSFKYDGKIVILQEYIEGYTIDSNTASYEQMIESARELGKIVNSMKKLDFSLPINDVKEWYSMDTLNTAIEKHRSLLKTAENQNEKQIIKELQDKISMIEYIKENINFDEFNYLTQMNTHGDYSVLQFIYKNNKIKAIIDFVSACKMPIVWEVIRSYSYIDKEAKNGELNITNLTNYVNEFCQYVKLNKYDIKYMPYLYLVQLLSSTFGYKQYLLDNSKIDFLDFAQFRTRLCKYLFNNASNISNTLLKEIIK